MRKKLTSLLLAIVMLLQVFIPPNIGLAEEEETLPQGSYVKVGEINAKSYDAKIMNELNRIAAKTRTSRSQRLGVSLFSSGPYFGENNEPKDEEKPKYFGNISTKLDLQGLDGNSFQWNEIFGVDESGKPKPAQIIFRQIDEDSSVDTGLYYMLQITKEGKYTWSDGEGNPTKLPLFSKSLKPYRYEVRIDERVSDKVKLLTEVLSGTQGSSPTFSPENAEGEIIANITLGLTYQQIASTKFKSEWHTGVDESERPDMKANFAFDDGGDDLSPVSVDLPKNDKDTKIIRDWYNEFEPDLVISYYLEKTPDVKIDTSTAGLTFDTTNKTVKSGDHKYKYDFTYDVINGGKLTMTEILPITFDANEGKFDSITDPKADQKIVKEVEYGKDLTDEVEKPKKDLETFKGWATDKDGKNPVKDDDFKNITEAKTFYAIWDNNDITAEELEVKESFKDKTGYVNDFVPDLEALGKQIKIKDEKGNLQSLDSGKHSFEILDDSENALNNPGYKDYLYEKLKEDPDTEVSRIVNIKAKVKFLKSNTSKEVIIPIKVIKNIYEAKTKEGKPVYVPDNYVKVTLDPTTKATDPQKTYYYVNPEANVVIPGEDPTGRDNYLFVGWKTPKTPDNEVFKLDERHKFAGETEIKAKYTKDVIPQEGDKKPDTVPDRFVKVIFDPTDKGDMEGAKIFWVNPEKEVIIPVTDPVGKQYQTFDKWKMGEKADGKEFNRTEAHRFSEKETTITATYKESPNIIPFDPTNTDDSTIVRPKGYVKVTFEADSGLKLTESKAYYVKKNAGIKLGNSKLVKPAYKEETGYKFKEWDKKDALVIEAADVVVTAKAESFKDVIPKINSEGGENKKPAGYITVKFSTETNGKIKGTDKTEKVVYVNPNKAVELTTYAPKVTPNTGYDFAAWDTSIERAIQYKDKDKITALYNKKGDVIPQENPNGSDKPAGYLIVTFDKGEHGKEITGKTVYYVKPNTEVTVPAPTVTPNTGWKQKDGDDAWNSELTQTFTKDTDITAQYDSIKDIIPRDEGGKENSKPDGYVTVTFKKGEHGKLEGKTVYYVNPEAGKKLDDITKPKVSPETGYKADGWDKEDTLEIKDNITVTAKYLPLDDVIPKTKEDESEKPDSYIKVTFKTTDKGGNIEKVVYINPNKAVALDKYAPEVTPIDGYEFAGWDKPITEKVQYNDNDVITAQFNEIGLISKVEKPGYVKVVFKEGEHGSLEGDINVWIKPDVDVRIPSPNVIAAEGYKFDGWDKNLKVKLSLDDSPYEITAQYKDIKEGGDTPINPNFKIKDIVTLPFDVNKGDSVDGRDWYKQVVPGDDYEIKRVDVNNPSEADTSKGNAFTSVKATITIRNKNTQEETTVESLIWIYVKEPCNNTCPNPGDNPGGGGYIPTPDPNPTLPDDGDDEKEPEDKEKTPDEENGKEKDPDKEKEDNPDKDKEETPEKPGDKDPKKPGQNQPPVKNDGKKNPGQTGTKIVKTIGQTGTKVINQVKNFLNPTTGIISNYGLYIGLMAASSVGLFFTRDKKNEDEE